MSSTKHSRAMLESLKQMQCKLIDQDQALADQSVIISRLTRENKELKEGEYRRSERLREMKQEAGFKQEVSFDIVWAQVLNAASSFNMKLHKDG